MGKRKVRQYTEEFKQSSAKLAMTSGKSTHQIAKELGIGQSTLHAWVKKYYSGTAKAGNDLSTNDLLAELKRLKKENARLTQERDILKKATAYFASETR